MAAQRKCSASGAVHRLTLIARKNHLGVLLLSQSHWQISRPTLYIGQAHHSQQLLALWRIACHHASLKRHPKKFLQLPRLPYLRRGRIFYDSSHRGWANPADTLNIGGNSSLLLIQGIYQIQRQEGHRGQETPALPVPLLRL